jgi:proteasome accessory factor A
MNASDTRLPKLCGTDVEVGNFILGIERATGSGAEASRALLREIEGYPQARTSHSYVPAWTGGDHRWNGRYGVRAREKDSTAIATYVPDTAGAGHALAIAPYYNPGPAASAYDRQDWGRKFLANGSCAYIDLDHLELASAETLSAYDQLACMHALLRVARGALSAANARLPRGQRLQVLVNNSDGSGSSYGSHVNVLLSRAAWNNIFDRKVHYLLYLAAFQISSIIFTGQGKVGSENHTPPVGYQISQRADFFETLAGPHTTCRRPIVNSRDEPLCGLGRSSAYAGPTDNKARLHVIFYDSTLCHVATLLKLGTLQIVLAMIEAGRIDARLILDDPLDAVVQWSHDPSLQARARLVDGTETTAAELQARFIEAARAFVEDGGCEGIVPRAGDIVSLWQDTVDRLLTRDFDALVPRLDWVLKMSILDRAIAQRPGLTWSSPQIKHLDHVYSSLDPDEGLYWAYERAGLVDRLVTDERVNWLVEHPPECSRAWTRGMLLRHAGAVGVEDANWDWVRIAATGRGGWRIPRTIHLANPLAWDQTQAGRVFDEHADLGEIADRLDAMASQADGATERRSSHGCA